MFFLDPALRVEIEDDPDLCEKFLLWQLDESVFAFRGGSSGLGNSIAWFPAEYEPKIRAFFSLVSQDSAKDEHTICQGCLGEYIECRRGKGCSESNTWAHCGKCGEPRPDKIYKEHK